MSQPPKSTIRAPSARCTALSGVVLSTCDLRKNKRGRRGGCRGAPSVLLPERFAAPNACGAACPFGGPPVQAAAALQIIDVRAVRFALSLIHISEPTRQAEISYAVFCLKKKK